MDENLLAILAMITIVSLVSVIIVALIVLTIYFSDKKINAKLGAKLKAKDIITESNISIETDKDEQKKQ